MGKMKMPERIPDTPENIALACMQGPPKKRWDYIKRAEEQKTSGATRVDESNEA